MKTIQLTRGAVALVDDVDCEFLSQWKWQASCCLGRLYAARDTHSEEGYVKMHRVIMNAKIGQIVDHIDGCTLNNQRANLRFADTSQNCFNRRKQRNTTSIFKGVRKHGNKFQAAIQMHGKQQHLGTFLDPFEAARVYDEAALHLHREFARTNKMMGLLP